MLHQLKNIESAFRHIKTFSLVLIVAVTGVCCSTVYWCITEVDKVQQRVYILSNGRLLEATAANRRDNLGIELKDHIKMFHFYFFTLSPDEALIKSQLTKALYLADGSAKSQYDNLKENGYYANLVAGNVNQRIEVDSISVDINEQPYRFRYYAKLFITRSTSIVTRSVITEGVVRDGLQPSENNLHGFLIERWNTIENRDINVQTR